MQTARKFSQKETTSKEKQFWKYTASTSIDKTALQRQHHTTIAFLDPQGLQVWE
jgi:hypothetical protein